MTTPPNPTPPGGTATDDPFGTDATRSLRAEPAPEADAAATV
ncbi:MAG: hypothetical protein QOE59_1134, partial [Actinomycetota bacterium]|nr:hypothetical protein [Actinomycetota bacterium]